MRFNLFPMSDIQIYMFRNSLNYRIHGKKKPLTGVMLNAPPSWKDYTVSATWQWELCVCKQNLQQWILCVHTQNSNGDTEELCVCTRTYAEIQAMDFVRTDANKLRICTQKLQHCILCGHTQKSVGDVKELYWCTQKYQQWIFFASVCKTWVETWKNYTYSSLGQWKPWEYGHGRVQNIFLTWHRVFPCKTGYSYMYMWKY